MQLNQRSLLKRLILIGFAVLVTATLNSCGSIKGSIGGGLAQLSESLPSVVPPSSPASDDASDLHAQVIGQPTGADLSTSIVATVSGTTLTDYKYKIGTVDDTDCTDSSGYSDSLPISSTIAADISTYSDGSYLILCVVGGVSSTDSWQSYSQATTAKWFRGMIHVNIVVDDEIFQEGNTSKNFTVTLDYANLIDTEVKYYVDGTGLANTDISSSGGSITIPAGSTTASISFNYFDNSLFEQEHSIRVILASTNSGAVIGSNQEAQKIITDDDSGSQLSGQMVSAGGAHTCAILSGGVLKCWGYNSNGQIGDGSTADNSVPSEIDSGTGYKKVTTGQWHTCGITVADKVKCWGAGNQGQIGNGSTSSSNSVPVAIDTATSYSEISAGYQFTCGITTTGVLKCWGDNTSYGMLGDGTTTDRLVPTVIDSGTSYSRVATGQDHTCAITTTGVLKCWGRNNYSKVGDGTTTTRLTPVIIDSGVSYAEISLGQFHTCGVTTTGVLKCWGDNSRGQIGDGSFVSPVSTPKIIDSGVSYSQVDLGTSHSCAIKADGGLMCWGSNDQNELGDGAKALTIADVVAPKEIDLGTTYLSVSSGSYFSCGVTSGSDIKCWGYNEHGRLGDSGVELRRTPVAINSGYSFTKLALGSGPSVAGLELGRSICGLNSLGELKCWGENKNGQVGVGSFGGSYSILKPVDQVNTFKDVSVGGNFSCAVSSAGQLKCWGKNNYGQLGDGTQVNKSSPIAVDEETTYSSIVASYGHACGITTAGALKCWGLNSYGQLGDGTNQNKFMPQLIDSGVSYASISLGAYHSCGITTTGALKCWGNNFYKQLGSGGSPMTSTSPMIIDSGVQYSKISLGYAHTCGITTTGVLKCWGYNNYSQLGDGGTATASSPLVIDSGVTYSSIELGDNHTCAITSTGVLKCWGRNTYGQVGDGTSGTIVALPAVIDSGVEYSDITAGETTTCGITTAGVYKCWGLNEVGQHGDGRLVFASVPTNVFRILDP